MARRFVHLGRFGWWLVCLLLLAGCTSSSTRVTTTTRPPMSSTTTTSAASSTSSTTLPATAISCSPDQLRDHFWLALPATGSTESGINLENSGSSDCALPVDPSTFELVTSAGHPLPAVLVSSGLRNGLTRTDFVLPARRSTGPLGQLWAEPGIHLQNRPLILAPGDRAVVILFGRDYVGGPARCVSARGWMAVGVGHGRLDVLRLPRSNGIFGTTPFDPTGSVFFSCGQVFVSPFLSWSEAVKVVGPMGQIVLQSRYGYLYRRAP
jgi:hypothetical protein